jgi:hypothetical protein
MYIHSESPANQLELHISVTQIGWKRHVLYEMSTYGTTMKRPKPRVKSLIIILLFFPYVVAENDVKFLTQDIRCLERALKPAPLECKSIILPLQQPAAFVWKKKIKEN